MDENVNVGAASCPNWEAMYDRAVEQRRKDEEKMRTIENLMQHYVERIDKLEEENEQLREKMARAAQRVVMFVTGEDLI